MPHQKLVPVRIRGVPICECEGIQKNSHMGSPRTHNEIVRIWGLTYIPSVNFVSNKTPQSTPICFIARKALSNPPLRPLCILYDATVNDPLPSAREGGSNAIIAIRFLLKKPKIA